MFRNHQRDLLAHLLAPDVDGTQLELHPPLTGLWHGLEELPNEVLFCGHGVDGAKANAHWFEAALRGMHLAQVRLALSFARGDGGKVDHQLAFVWAYVAKDKDANARIILDAVTQAISAEEVAALEREAHGVMQEMKSIDPNDKRRFSQGI